MSPSSVYIYVFLSICCFYQDLLFAQEIFESLRKSSCIHNTCLHDQIERCEDLNKHLKMKVNDLYRKLEDKDRQVTSLQLEAEGWNCTSTSCYYASDYRAVWEHAATNCSGKGAHLAIITSAEEDAKVIAIAEANTMNGTAAQHHHEFTVTVGKAYRDGFWLDGTDVREEGTWIWNTTGKNIIYRNFHQHEPNNDEGSADCLELWYSKGILKWNDAPCTIGKRQFICETDL